MVRQVEHRRSPLATAAFGLVAARAAWESFAFVGGATAAARGQRTQAKGWRFDWMLEQKDGTGTLQTTDGYFVGEQGFEKAQAAKGLRYRMRPFPDEYRQGIETDGLLWQIGPFKVKLGEAFGGTGNNPRLRELKKKIVTEPLDPLKIEENEYWLARYGHQRWGKPYVDQSSGQATNFLRGLAAWSGLDPLVEEKGKTWFEVDYGKPWLSKYIGRHQNDGKFVSPEQVEKEYQSGRLGGGQPRM